MSDQRDFNFEKALARYKQVQTLAKENKVSEEKADFFLNLAESSKKYREFAMNNVMSSKPDAREREKFASLLAHDAIKKDKKGEDNDNLTISAPKLSTRRLS